MGTLVSQAEFKAEVVNLQSVDKAGNRTGHIWRIVFANCFGVWIAVRWEILE